MNNQVLEQFFLVSFEPTYEELKPTSNPTSNGLAPVLSLPMRNWNLTKGGCSNDAGVCFEPTYEELKPRQEKDELLALIPFWAYLWGIETFFLNLHFFSFTYSFEPTYEELKPYLPLPACLSVDRVLSLPMRNWNLYQYCLPDSLSPFWAYLWGIET